MTIKTTKWMAGVAGALVLALAGSARAGHGSDLDRLARRIEAKTVHLRREAAHFRGAPGHVDFMRDVNEVRRLAAHIRRDVHHGASVHHLAGDVRGLHRALDHLQRVVARLGRHVYPGGHYDYDLHHVAESIHATKNCVREMEAVLHALGAGRSPAPLPRVRPPHPHPVPVVTPHARWYGPRYGHGGGITIQRGGLRISFGF